MIDSCKKDLPRICYILGGEETPLQIGEMFSLRLPDGRIYHDLWVESDGNVHAMANQDALTWAINHPENVIRLPSKKQFTDEQKSLLKALLKFGLRFITRDENESLWACDNKAKVKFNTCWYGLNGKILKLPIDLFPQIKWEDEEPFDIKAYFESEVGNDD